MEVIKSSSKNKSSKNAKEELQELLNNLINSQKNADSINQQDKDGNTVMHYACMHGKTMIAIQLFALGGNLNIKNNNGDTPLTAAAKGKHFDTVLELRKMELKQKQILKDDPKAKERRSPPPGMYT